MSFILDALKKAEAERQRQTGPTLLEVRVSAPRRRIPLWTLIIGALLGINILLLLVFVLRRPATNAVTPAAPAATAPLTSTAPSAAPAPAAAAPAAVAPPAAAAATALPAPFAGGVLSPPGAVGEDRIPENPADYEPALPPVGGSTQRRATDSPARNEPPSLSDIGGDFPDLRLDLHVYAARAADRYALINMHRVHEGDVLPEGPRVVAIDRDGVELSYRGTEFMLHPQ